MNKQIKELAEQAGAKIHKEQTRSGYWVDFSNYDGFDHEKFAELLIQKCMSLTERCMNDNTIFALNGAEIIAEHFGVEE
jgi:hypothetical protein